jgi:glucose-6-phosphate 1-dehydrogenase
MSTARSDALLFCGATGDLAYKKIFPAPGIAAARVLSQSRAREPT